MNKKSLLIIALIVLIIIAGGFYYFTQTETVDTTPNQTVTKNEPTTLIVIKELGLMFQAQKGISDLTYSIKSLGDFGEAAYFSTKSLSSLQPNCSSTYNSIGAVAVLTQKQWEDALGGLDQTGSTTSSFDSNNPNTPVHLGSRYVIYDGPGGLCADNKATEQLQRSQAALLVKSLSTLEATTTSN